MLSLHGKQRNIPSLLTTEATNQLFGAFEFLCAKINLKTNEIENINNNITNEGSIAKKARPRSKMSDTPVLVFPGLPSFSRLLRISLVSEPICPALHEERSVSYSSSANQNIQEVGL